MPADVHRIEVGPPPAPRVTLAVTCRGDGPCLLFVHGFPFDRTMWADVQDSVVGWLQVAPDLRGMGRSDAPVGGYGMAAYAGDLVGILDHLRIEQAVVCGLSMGGYVAFEMHRRYPERVRALVLAHTRADPDDAAARDGRDAMIELARTAGPVGIAERMLPRVLAPRTLDERPEVVRRVRAMIEATPVEGIVGALQAMKERPDSSPGLAGVRVPTLVVAGNDDLVTPAPMMHEMAAEIPGAEFVLLPDVGHLSPLEDPPLFAEVLGEFLEGLQDRG